MLLALLWLGAGSPAPAHAGGTVVAWGDNSFGQCNVPAGLNNVVAISAGFGFSLALQADGTVVGWGNLPAAMPASLTNVTAISSGVIFSLALKSDGTVVAWGDDTYGQIDVPPGLSNVVSIVAGDQQGLTVQNDGALVTWGYVTNPSTSASNVVAMAGENYQNLFLLTDGSVVTDPAQFSLTPGFSDGVAVAAQYYAGAALTAFGTVYSWPQNTPTSSAGPLDGFTNVVAVAGFWDHWLALQQNGNLLLTGSDSFGQTTPPTLNNVIAIATGGGHGLALIGSGAATIVQPPVARTLISGYDANFSVGAVGAGTLSYQWQYNGTNLPGATNSLLKIASAQIADQGQYAVTVTGPYNSVTSAPVPLVINPVPPQLVQIPVPVAGWLSNSASFAVSATGSLPLFYQWQCNGVNLAGQTNSTLNLTNLQFTDAGLYSVAVSNPVGSTNPPAVALTVGGLAEALNATNLVWQTYDVVPWSVYADGDAHDGIAAAAATPTLSGQAATLQTTAAGPATVSFWWKMNSPVYGCTITLAQNSAVLPLASPGTAYQMATCYLPAGTNLLQWVCTNGSAYNVAEFSGWLDQVSYVPGGTAAFVATPPTSQTQAAGTNVTFNVTASGTPPFGYQWLFNGVAIPGATNPSYQFYVYDTNAAGAYAVLITNNFGAVTSSPVLLTVLEVPPGIYQPPSDQIVMAGGNASFNVLAAGSPPYYYQWLFQGAPLSGQTNGSLLLPNVATNQAGTYTVVITTPYGSVTSHPVSLFVNSAPFITQQPTNQTGLAGSSLFLTVGVAGGGPYTYQWQLNGTNLNNVSNLISTVAGVFPQLGYYGGFSGDGAAATNANLYNPCGVAADSLGNFYFADQNNHRIRKVNTAGIITTVAGKGSLGAYGGDGGQATNALLYRPADVTLDGKGNLYLADEYNHRVRKVATNGIITTVAGLGSGGYNGDGLPATSAKLTLPAGVCLDATGNLYIADSGNNRVREVLTNGIMITVAGNGAVTNAGDFGPATSASVYNPVRVLLDAAGNLLITEGASNVVRRVDTNGMITTLAGTGKPGFTADGVFASQAGLSAPTALVQDLAGNLYIADGNDNRVRQVEPTGVITTVAGGGQLTRGSTAGNGQAATNASLYNPSGLAIDPGGNLLIGDAGNNMIRKVALNSPRLWLPSLNAATAGNYAVIVTSPLGSATSQVATVTVLLPPSLVAPLASQSAGLGSNATFTAVLNGTAPLTCKWLVNGVALPPQTSPSLTLTNVQWTNAGTYQVVVTNNYGSITSAVATLTVGVPPAIASPPAPLAVLAGQPAVLGVTVTGGGPFYYQWQLNGTNLPPIITTVAGNGTNGYNGDGQLATSARLNDPLGIALDATNDLLIADLLNYRLRKVDTNGFITTVAGTGVSGETGSGGPATNAALRNLWGVAADVAGNVYFSESTGSSSVVRKINPAGTISVAAGGGSAGEGIPANTAQLYYAEALTVDNSGNLLIADTGYYRIRKVGTNGLITTLAGNPKATTTGGFSGDGGIATNATLGTVDGLAVDTYGNVYIDDNGNARIRQVSTNGMINTVIGGGASTSDGALGTNTALAYPNALAVDHNNNVYVLSSYRLRKMDTNGVMTTVAGAGTSFPGDYGPALSASFHNPISLAVDALNNVYVTDDSFSRVHKIHFSGDPTLTLPAAAPGNTGIYSVTVTSPFGSVTSLPATLEVGVVPNLQAVTVTNGQVNLTWKSVATLNYQWQYTVNLAGTNWINLGGPLTATNNTLTTTDQPGTDSQRFYRLIWLP